MVIAVLTLLPMDRVGKYYPVGRFLSYVASLFMLSKLIWRVESYVMLCLLKIEGEADNMYL